MDTETYADRLGTDTTGRYDVTPLFRDPETLRALCGDLRAALDSDVTAVAGIDALGFVVGTALAMELGVGFVPVRKGGKLPYSDSELHSSSLVDYSGQSKTLALHTEALDTTDRVLLVDDWVETGAQMRTAGALVESAGASVAAVAVIGAPEDEHTALSERYTVHSLL